MTPDDAPTTEVTGADVLVLLGLVLITVALVALAGWAIACLVDGTALVALGVNRAHTAGGDQ